MSENTVTNWEVLDSAHQALRTTVLGVAQEAWNRQSPCALDAAVHAWDLAMATGQPSPLSPALARTLMTVATNIVEPLRAYGVYAPALEPVAGDDEVAALLRYLGRRPDWTA